MTIGMGRDARHLLLAPDVSGDEMYDAKHNVVIALANSKSALHVDVIRRRLGCLFQFSRGRARMRRTRKRRAYRVPEQESETIRMLQLASKDAARLHSSSM
jgi:hypothetical protein